MDGARRCVPLDPARDHRDVRVQRVADPELADHALVTHWFRVAWHDGSCARRCGSRSRSALAATAIALVLGTMASFAIHRFSFFGRDSVSFLLLLPIALPGIITGMALNSFFSFAGVRSRSGRSSSATRRSASWSSTTTWSRGSGGRRRSLLEASMDLGADGWQTFRFVTWPVLSTALVAGGLLAFALSFDEVIVTTFTAGAQTTLPIFILDNLRQGQQLPIVNVVAFVVILLTIDPGVGLTTADDRRRRAFRRPGGSRYRADGVAVGVETPDADRAGDAGAAEPAVAVRVRKRLHPPLT